jgi:formylglycine-generating enzyme required for sulfatase activity
MLAQVRPHVLDAAAERALKPGDSFKECARDCPEMVVIPAGEFTMGSPASEQGRSDAEQPQHRVVFAKPLAVARFDVTFDDWDACVAYGDCARAPDVGFGRGRQPVINVNWFQAQQYAAWLSRMTGKPYRLLSEAEFEYAARAGTLTAYPWGDDVAKPTVVRPPNIHAKRPRIVHANCAGCGSKWDNRQPSPVGSFAPNGFGLYDMHGNVLQWVEDCLHGDYEGAPRDGSAWTAGDCARRIMRGGSYNTKPWTLRSASRFAFPAASNRYWIGFRVRRTLTP